MRALLAMALATLAAFSVLALAGVVGGEDESDGPGTSGAGARGPALEARIRQIYRQSRESVVYIQARVAEDRSPFGPPQRGGVATGTGFLYDEDGHTSAALRRR
jgi:hypothetical protein